MAEEIISVNALRRAIERGCDMQKLYLPIHFMEIIDDMDKHESEKEIEGGDGGGSWWFVCGECHAAIDPKDKYCRECGRRLKWT